MAAITPALPRAVRAVLRSPGLLGFATIALGLGIAAPATMFTIAQGVLRDLPVPAGERLVHIYSMPQSNPQERTGLREHDLLAVGEQTRTLQGVAGFTFARHNAAAPGERPERHWGARVTPNTFRVLGVAPAAGRDFTAADGVPGAPPVVIIGDALWRTRLGGSHDVVGSTLRIDGEPTRIIGVMPPGFEFPNIQQLWTPLRLDAAALPARDGWRYEVIGRLAPNATLDAARAELATLAAGLERMHAASNTGVQFGARPWSEHMLAPNLRRILGVMVALVFCVLLVASANVANLLVARGLARSRSVAIRAALGAGRRRLIGEHLLETLLIAACGGMLGLALTHAATGAFARALASELPYWADFSLAWPTLIFSAVCILVAAAAAGLLPALQAAGVDVHEALQDESRGTSSFRLGRASQLLVVAQVAFSCTLLIVAGLMIKGVLTMSRTAGFVPERVLVAQYEVPRSYEPERLPAFHRGVVERVAALPGVAAAAVTTSPPGLSAGWQRVDIEGVDHPPAAERPTTRSAAISPGFFAAVGARPVLRGRDFLWSDVDGALRVALVNESFVQRLLPDEDPIGRRVRWWRSGAEPGPWLTIVGVAPDVGVGNAAGEAGDGIYVPLTQQLSRGVAVLLHTHADPLALLHPLHAAVGALEPDLPLFDAGRLDRLIGQTHVTERVFGVLFAGFGLASLLLAVIGLYGTISFTVTRRRRELGIRTALGAGPWDVFLLPMRAALAQIGIGAVLGVIVAALVAPLLGDALFGIHARDPVVYALVTGALVAAGSFAALRPALRAAGTRPATVLQEK